MEVIVSSLLMFSGILSIISSGIPEFKRGLTLLIVGFIVFMVGYFIFPWPQSNTIVLKSNKSINTDSIYVKGYKDGIKDCSKK
jgi:hypothetical protein